MPDLIVFSDFEPEEFFFAEVKSPNDRLSDSQRAWINFLEENKFSIKLLKIREI